MYTTSRVIKVLDDRTVLVGCISDACKGCKAEMFCNNKNDTEFTAKKGKNLEVHPGDRVELFMPPGKTVGSVGLVFALPLAFFPIGYLLMKNNTGANELVNALAGFAAMAVAFTISACITVRHKRALMPEITKTINLEESK